MREYTFELLHAEERFWGNFEDFTTTLTKELVNDLESGVDPNLIKVTFKYTAEGSTVVVNNKWFVEAMHNFCDKYRIPLKNVTYLGSNFKIRKVYDKWHALHRKESEKINLVTSCFGIQLYCKDSHWFGKYYCPETPVKGIRKYKTNNLNANMLKHRVMWLEEMFDQDLLDTDNNIISFHLQKEFARLTRPEIAEICPIQYDVKGNWDEVYKELLTQIPGTPGDHNKLGNYSNIYDNSYITVTTESCECYTFADYHSDPTVNAYMREFHEEGFITEKTFRPMLYWHPQLFVSTPGTIEFLKDLGFKTFSDYWNEDYDNEHNGKKRIEMVANELTKINNMSIDQIHEMYWDMMPILEHNRALLQTIDFDQYMYVKR